MFIHKNSSAQSFKKYLNKRNRNLAPKSMQNKFFLAYRMEVLDIILKDVSRG